jgi:hypothetical protein
VQSAALDESDRLLVTVALLDMPMWPARARGLGAWLVREFEQARVQPWLEGFAEPERPSAFTNALGLTAGLFGRLAEAHEPLPHYRTMRWDALLMWAAERSAELDARMAAWEERQVVTNFLTAGRSSGCARRRI